MAIYRHILNVNIMNKITPSEVIKFLWVGVVCVILYMITKFFGKKSDDQESAPPIPGNENYNNTTETTGLTPNDLSLYNQVISNLSNAVPISFDMSWYEYLFPFTGLFDATENLAGTQGSYELAEMLEKVRDKRQFALTFLTNQGTTLDAAIVAGYGEYAYQLIAKNVTNFVQFII